MMITKEGTLASFYTVNKAPIKHLRVYFSPKQAGEGTPSPSNVREISGWNKITVTQTKKNLFPTDINYFEFPTTAWNSSSVPNDFMFANGEYSGTVPQGVRDCCVMITKTTFPPGTYTISFDYNNESESTTWQPLILAYNNGGGWYSGFSGLLYVSDASGHREKTFTATQSFYISLCLHSFGNAPKEGHNRIYNLQLTTESSATNYEKCIYNVYNVNFDTAYYGGYVDLITGELVETHKLVDVSTLSYNYFSKYNVWRSFDITDGVYHDGLQTMGVLSNQYTEVANFTNGEVANYSLCLNSSAHGKVLFIRNSDFDETQSEAFATSLQGVNIVYPLQTPITHQLTPTQLSTLIGRNNIWSNADRVEVEYDLAESNDELYRRRNILLRSAPHIETASGSIAHFETDIVAPIKSAIVRFSPVQEGSGDPSPENVRAISGWSGLTIGNQSFNPGPYTAYTENNGSYCDIRMGQNFKFEGISDGLVLLNIYRQDDSGIGSLRPMKNTNGVQWDTYTATEDIARFIFVNSQVTNGYVYMLNNTTEIDWSTAAGTIYGGYIDLVSGELVATHIVEEENGLGFTFTNTAAYQWRHTPCCPGDTWNLGLCSHWKSTYYANENFALINSNGAWFLGRDVFEAAGVSFNNEGLQAWLAAEKQKGTPIQLGGPLVTPIHYQLSPQSLRALRGTNNIWSNANGTIEVKYWRH